MSTTPDSLPQYVQPEPPAESGPWESLQTVLLEPPLPARPRGRSHRLLGCGCPSPGRGNPCG